MSSASKAALKKTSRKVSSKNSAQKEEVKIKYEDKSQGQPQLLTIFEEIKKMLIPYEKGTMKLFGGDEGKVMLISKKPVEIAGRKKDELWFASLLVQKGYVGFYYMPVYGDPKIKEMIGAELMKCLKGKACFHIKKFDEQIFSQIKDALKLGYDRWHKFNWI